MVIKTNIASLFKASLFKAPSYCCKPVGLFTRINFFAMVIYLFQTWIERFVKKIKDSLFNPLILCDLKAKKLKDNSSPFGSTRQSFMSTKITKTGFTNNKISDLNARPVKWLLLTRSNAFFKEAVVY
jgi:hypothetical protein